MISQSKRQTIKFLRITLSNSDSLFSSSCSNIKNLTPNSLESGMLKLSPQAPKVFPLGEYTISSHKKTIDTIS